MNFMEDVILTSFLGYDDDEDNGFIYCFLIQPSFFLTYLFTYFLN